MPGKGGPSKWPGRWLLLLWMALMCNQWTMNLEGPTQQWISRHYPTYRSLEVFQVHRKLRHSEEMLGELWLDGANSTTARYRRPSVDLLMIIRPSSAIASYFTCLATRPPRRRINLLQSLHTLLHYAHLPRHGSFGFDRGQQTLDRTDAQLLRDRPHRNTNGPPAVLRPHDRHSAHVLQTYRLACRAVNRSFGFSSSPAFDPISRTLAVLTVYHSLAPSFSGPDTPLTSVSTTWRQLPAQLGQLAHIFVVKVLHVVPFRHAEHAKTFLRGIRGIGTFKASLFGLASGKP